MNHSEWRSILSRSSLVLITVRPCHSLLLSSVILCAVWRHESKGVGNVVMAVSSGIVLVCKSLHVKHCWCGVDAWLQPSQSLFISYQTYSKVSKTNFHTLIGLTSITVPLPFFAYSKYSLVLGNPSSLSICWEWEIDRLLFFSPLHPLWSLKYKRTKVCHIL